MVCCSVGSVEIPSGNTPFIRAEYRAQNRPREVTQFSIVRHGRYSEDTYSEIIATASISMSNSGLMRRFTSTSYPRLLHTYWLLKSRIESPSAVTIRGPSVSTISVGSKSHCQVQVHNVYLRSSSSISLRSDGWLAISIHGKGSTTVFCTISHTKPISGFVFYAQKK